MSSIIACTVHTHIYEVLRPYLLFGKCRASGKDFHPRLSERKCDTSYLEEKELSLTRAMVKFFWPFLSAFSLFTLLICKADSIWVSLAYAMVLFFLLLVLHHISACLIGQTRHLIIYLGEIWASVGIVGSITFSFPTWLGRSIPHHTMFPFFLLTSSSLASLSLLAQDIIPLSRTIRTAPTALNLTWYDVYPLDLKGVLDLLSTRLRTLYPGRVLFLVREDTCFQAYPDTPLWAQLEGLLDTLPAQMDVEHPLLRLLEKQRRPIWLSEWTKGSQPGLRLPHPHGKDDPLLFPICFGNLLIGILFIQLECRPSLAIDRLVENVSTLLARQAATLQRKRILTLQQQRRQVIQTLSLLASQHALAEPAEILAGYCKEISDLFHVSCSGWVTTPYEFHRIASFEQMNTEKIFWPSSIPIRDGQTACWHENRTQDDVPLSFHSLGGKAFAWVPIADERGSILAAILLVFSHHHFWNQEEVSVWQMLMHACGTDIANARQLTKKQREVLDALINTTHHILSAQIPDMEERHQRLSG